MTSLTFSQGQGRLLRSSTAIVFSTEPADDLFALFADDRPADFKALASMIVANDFDMCPFAVVALEAARIFVFGNLDVHLGDESLSGSTSDTWVERAIEPDVPIVSGEQTEGHGDLTLGWVAAGGFCFGSSAAEAVDTPAAEADSDEDSTSSENTQDVEPGAVEAIVVEPDDPAPNLTGSSRLEEEDLPAFPAPVTEAAPLAAADSPMSDEEWDPLADPEVDLERIGAQEIVETAIPPPKVIIGPAPEADPKPAMESTDAEDLFLPEDTRDTKTPPPPSPAPNVIPPPPMPAGIAPPSVAPSAVIPPPPGAQLPVAPVKASPTIPAPAEFQPTTSQLSARNNIRFDDGQSAALKAGIYVGRHPTKNGLPDEYSSVTIRGEHVSRLHFELAIDGHTAVVRDLGSNSGTEVEINGRRIPVPDGGMQISPGAKILFADRWAIYETE